jgi:gamma-glutamyltranspeptidase/glutathione hydrolase
VSTRGAVAAGHPLTAEAGADVLRDGGNAVDAALAAVLTSFATESPLTGFGAGGYMLVHLPDGVNTLIDFFVETPGRGAVERQSELVPIPVYFTADTDPQVFHIGAASCGVPGNPAGLEHALERFGTMPMSRLVEPAVRAARDGVVLTSRQAYFFEILAPILMHTREGAAIYAPDGEILREGETFRFEELADALERFAAEGSVPFYSGDIAARVAEWVLERGGTLTPTDLAAYEPIEREPVRVSFHGHEVLTNPPPSSGGILIAFALEFLERRGACEVEDIAAAMDAAQTARTAEFLEGLYAAGFAERFLAANRLGSTTHITAVDAHGRCASVTCSNGTGSGLIVPGTGVHVNNMLGEEDLHPLGFHRHPPAVRLPSMMSPTVILDRHDDLVAGLGSGGSNRIRSAILQVIIRMLDEPLVAEEAVEAARMHLEGRILNAEPGIDEPALERLAAGRYEVVRWPDRNVFFGGVHAVTRDPDTGELSGGGDPRRGGAVAYA